MVGAREERSRVKNLEDQRKVTSWPSSGIGAVGQVEDLGKSGQARPAARGIGKGS